MSLCKSLFIGVIFMFPMMETLVSQCGTVCFRFGKRRKYKPKSLDFNSYYSKLIAV